MPKPVGDSRGYDIENTSYIYIHIWALGFGAVCALPLLALAAGLLNFKEKGEEVEEGCVR